MKQTDKLIRMANRIGDYFAAMPDRAQAVSQLANHLRKSWEPRMRSDLIACLGTPAKAQIRPLVREALDKL